MIYYLTKAVFLLFLKLFFRTKVTGLEHIPHHGPFIVASNHRSFVDSLLIPLVVHRKVRFLAKSEYFTGPGWKGRISRIAFTSIGSVPVDRDTSKSAQLSLEAGLQVLRDGDGFGIYPEGTRSRDGLLYRGRTGVGWLALASGAPVIPVGLRGTARVQAPDEKGIRPFRTLSVTFGPPVNPEDYRVGPAGAARRALTDEVMDRIAVLCGQTRSASYNQRPTSHDQV